MFATIVMNQGGGLLKSWGGQICSHGNRAEAASSILVQRWIYLCLASRIGVDSFPVGSLLVVKPVQYTSTLSRAPRRMAQLHFRHVHGFQREERLLPLDSEVTFWLSRPFVHCTSTVGRARVL